MWFKFVILLVITSAKADDISSGERKIEYRLPNNTRPISYDIHLITNIHRSNSQYSGVESIYLVAVEDTNQIVIHAHDLIDDIKVSLSNKEGFEFKNISYTREEDNDFLKIFSEPEPLDLKEGKEYILTIAFNGYLNERGNGFYKSYYLDNNKNRIWFASTFFEPVYARRAFPCYDEPMLKAKFSIAITHGANYSAISNMPIDGTTTKGDGDMTTTRFKQTPPMSTYTVAFVVGNYENISVQINNITHAVFSLPVNNYKGEFALDIASRTLQICEDYFETKYPLPKMDHVGVPSFPAGGMENWGLIIYDENHLLSYSNISELNNSNAAMVIVHETVHQWFGNLVSPKWWNHVWLSEGITTFYTFKILEMLNPKWKSSEMGLIECGTYSGFTDSVPMTEYMESESYISLYFDPIYYCKGFKLMRMFEHALTKATLKKGIIKYLKKHQYSAVDENDLFNCLQDAATEDNIPVFEEPGMVKKIFSSWTGQDNYPMITVERDYESGTFTLIQSSAIHRDVQTWWIPITFSTASNPNFDDNVTDFILPNEEKFRVDPAALNKTLLANDWLMLNNQQIGMYRVSYDEKNWNLIIDALKKDPKIIHSLNKAQFIRDAFDLDFMYMLPGKVQFNLLSYLETEDDVYPWIQAIKYMRSLLQDLPGSKIKELFKYFARDMVKLIYKTVGVDRKSTDDNLTEYLRLQLSEFVCKIEMEDCLETVGKL